MSLNYRHVIYATAQKKTFLIALTHIYMEWNRLGCENHF